MENLAINSKIEDGDYGRQYAEVTIGSVSITVYQSEGRAGGVTVEIDTHAQPSDLAVYCNDDQIL